MTVLVATDKFKGSLSAREVCEAVREGIQSKYESVEVVVLPLADGGEGTLDLLMRHTQGKIIRTKVSGPLFEEVDTEYGFSDQHKTAYIEIAKVCGLQLVPTEKQNPLRTTSLGVGQLILHALDRGTEKFIIAIGGSATNDGGMGMATALGYAFNDSKKQPLTPSGASLPLLYNIERNQVDPRLRSAKFVALCDVTNGLHGPRGAAFRFAPQKGANPEAVQLLDNGLKNFEKIVQKNFEKNANIPGSGAGGGLGFGCAIFLNAELAKGMDYVKDIVHLENRIQESNLVVTGEGRVDQDSFSGKVVGEVVASARRLGKPVVVLCGVTPLAGDELKKKGVDRIITLVDTLTDSAQAMRNAHSLIVNKIKTHLEL